MSYYITCRSTIKFLISNFSSFYSRSLSNWLKIYKLKLSRQSSIYYDSLWSLKFKILLLNDIYKTSQTFEKYHNNKKIKEKNEIICELERNDFEIGWYFDTFED